MPPTQITKGTVNVNPTVTPQKPRGPNPGVKLSPEVCVPSSQSPTGPLPCVEPAPAGRRKGAKCDQTSVGLFSAPLRAIQSSNAGARPSRTNPATDSKLRIDDLPPGRSQIRQFGTGRRREYAHEHASGLSALLGIGRKRGSFLFRRRATQQKPGRNFSTHHAPRHLRQNKRAKARQRTKATHQVPVRAHGQETCQ